jgi:hypothetical protein
MNSCRILFHRFQGCLQVLFKGIQAIENNIAKSFFSQFVP